MKKTQNFGTKKEKIMLSKFLKIGYVFLRYFSESDTAIYLSYLIEMDDYIKKKDKDGYFMATRPYTKSRIGLSARTQTNSAIKLVNEGLISMVKKKVTPPKIYIKVNKSAVQDLINTQTKIQKEMDDQLEDGFYEEIQKTYSTSNQLQHIPN